jgi:hypothetical protein
MTPLTAFLLIALIVAVAIIAVLLNDKNVEDRAKDEPSQPPVPRKPLTDAECAREYKKHRPNVSAAVLKRLQRIQREYVEGEGIKHFVNCAGFSTHGEHSEGYSLRIRQRVENGFRVVCFSYNKIGKFYSIQDTHANGGYMGTEGKFICRYQ